jgi:transcriptional regulator with XRE-family HTH domain
MGKEHSTAKMLALKTELEVAQELAARVRTARLQLGWSQDELARRAGLRPVTYRLFEQTGRIALLRLLRVLSVLGRLPDVDQVCALSDAPRSLDELLVPARQRGRRTKRA